VRDDGCPVVLLVEDRPSVRNLLEILLPQHGLSVASASTGDEALILARMHAPDLVLLDLLLPGMRSDVFLEAFRALPGASLVPVVIMSGLSGGLAAALTSGAQAYITKPFDMADLLGVLDEQIAARRRALGAT
jgi:CheY-like chemotaxis protein